MKKKYALSDIKQLSPFKLLSPVVIWMLLFFIVPLLLVVIVSFMQRGQYGDIKYVLTIGNYKNMINLLYLNVFIKSLGIAIVTTLVCLIFGYPFAYFIAKAPRKFSGILLLLVMIPFWTNSLVRTYAWIILLRTEGIINTYLMALHIIKTPLQLLYNNTAVFIGMFYMMFPFMVLPIYTSVEKLDKSYLEAASDLGANNVITFAKITLPLTMSGVISGCMLVFVPTLGYFFIPDLMGGSKVLLLSNLIKNQFLAARNWPFGSAISVILIVVMLLIIGMYFKLTKKHQEGQVL
ncbi:ABC transporter permease [Candidatus Clostridium stratigraminis]|uniref:ABC transporter permease n=1 Tax=Candidatus Clostridium stratigraminis TaxID=3381661 RepID=A0ABW8T6G3_9CLOT